MDIKGEAITRERTRRPIRNKRSNRRVFAEEKRPPKRLFTPEIKKFLKDWLVRRRDNPYPNRDEKKSLAVQTGLTYIQVCNWFANWRRKLKNSSNEIHKKTWGNLIKTYNSQVQGNVEHFSICSEDSIWEENEDYSIEGQETDYPKSAQNFYSTWSELVNNNNNNKSATENQNQCFFVSSTTENDTPNPFTQANKYKNHIMEKYLKDCQQPIEDKNETKPSLISKWLESAANFKPSEHSYLDWSFPKNSKKKNRKRISQEEYNSLAQIHGKEELDAAEALTTLANAKFQSS